MVNEIWKPIEGFDKYEVSNLGRVRSVPRCSDKVITRNDGKSYQEKWTYKGKVLKHVYPGYTDEKPCAYVHLYRDTRHRENIAVKRLVARAFMEGFDDNSVKTGKIKHKDGDTRNCCISNLYIDD